MDYINLRIVDAVKDMNRQFYLPDIQREFVWDVERIERLFDSIMQGYPIGTFLFWRVDEEHKKDWDIYEFIRDFDVEDPHNKPADLSGVNRDIHLVLDGQQRLTSLLIGLKGSYRYHYYKWRVTKLFLNILKPEVPDEDNPEEPVYEFRFIEEPDVKNTEDEFWYSVGRILDFEDAEDAKDDIKPQIAALSVEKQDIANRLIGKLHNRIHTTTTLNYYSEKTKDYDKVLEIFVRANSGGKVLEYSDLLLSTATAKWKNLNARQEINKFTDDINLIGNGFYFKKDFVMKGCLYLTEDLPVQYQIKNFTRDNLLKVEGNWEDTIKPSIETSVRLISKFGYMAKNLVAPFSLLPIALFISKLNKKNFVKSSDKADVQIQNSIQKWLALVLMKNAFGSSTDTKLVDLRKVINGCGSSFPFDELINALDVTASLSDGEIEGIFQYQYGAKYTFLAMSLLYPDRDWKDVIFHEDHIYPKRDFTRAKLSKRGYDESKISEYQKYYNTILNLQLITDSENLEKNATPFEDWIKTREDAFKKRHHIPEMNDYGFDKFLDFVEARKKMLTNFYKAI